MPTPIPVLAPGLGKTKTGRLWTCVRDERPAAGEVAPAVWFAYSPDRKGEHPRNISKISAAFCKPMGMRASRKSSVLTADTRAAIDQLRADAVERTVCMPRAGATGGRRYLAH
jgi:hypothetical protein